MIYNFTFDTLCLTLLKYLERNDDQITAMVPTFIMLAQRRIDKDCKNLGLLQYVGNSFTQGQSVLIKPSDWRNTVTFNVASGVNENVYTQLYPRTYEFCRQYWPDDSKMDFPKYYCDYNFNSWLVVPTPLLPYKFQIAYYQTVSPISEEQQSNWLTQNAPELIFYATMLESMLYLKNDERTQYWRGLYTESLGAFNNEDMARLQDRTSQIKPGAQ